MNGAPRGQTGTVPEIRDGSGRDAVSDSTTRPANGGRNSSHLPPSATLAEARRWGNAKLKRREDFGCPVCGRLVRVARRRIHRRQAETLVAIYVESRRRMGGSTAPDRAPWIHVEHELVQTGRAPNVGHDWAQLRHWGVIEPQTSDRHPGRAGYWRLTKLGLWAGESPRRPLLAEWVDTWDGRAVARSSRLVPLVQCLGRAFDYEQEIRQGGRAA